MKHLIILYYLAAFSSGLASLTVFILLWIRFKHSLLVKYIMLLLILTLLVVDNAVYYYMNSLISQAGNLSLSIFTVFHFIVFSSLTFLLPLLSFQALNKPVPRPAFVLFSVLSGAAVPLMIIPFLAFHPLSVSLNWLYLGLYGFYFYVFLATLIFCLVLLLFQAKNVKDVRRKQIIQSASWLTIIFIPSFLLDALWTYFQVENPLIPRGLNFMPLFYLSWNLTSLLFAARFLFSSTDKEVAVISIGNIPPGFNTAFRLSAQEIKVMELALQGVTNSEIAEKLFITPGTAKNHMHSVYEKTGAKNRTSLAVKIKNFIQ